MISHPAGLEFGQGPRRAAVLPHGVWGPSWELWQLGVSQWPWAGGSCRGRHSTWQADMWPSPSTAPPTEEFRTGARGRAKESGARPGREGQAGCTEKARGAPGWSLHPSDMWLHRLCDICMRSACGARLGFLIMWQLGSKATGRKRTRFVEAGCQSWSIIPAPEVKAVTAPPPNPGFKGTELPHT